MHRPRSPFFADRGRCGRRSHAIGALLLAAVVASPAVADWLPEVPITSAGIETEIGLNHTPLIYDQEGGLVVTWAQRDTPNSNFQIYARRRPWATFEPAALVVAYPDPQPGSLLGAKFPSLALLGADSLLVAWHDYRHGGIFNCEIYARSMALDGGLGTQLRLTTTMNTENPGDNGYVPTAIATGSDIHVAWYDYRWDPNRADIFAKRRLPNGTWVTALGDSSDVNVSGSVTQGRRATGAPAIAAAPDGSLHVVWIDFLPGEYRLRHARFMPGSGYSPPTTVHSSTAFLEAPSAAVDPSGVLHVVWVDARAGNRALWVRSQPPGGAFGAELRLTDPAADAGDPALIATADGALHLTWQDARISATNREIFYRRRASGIPWDVSGLADVRLSTASGLSDRPSIVADESSPPNLAVLWRDRRSGVSEVVLREFRPGGPIGIAELSAPGIPGPWLVLGPNPGSGVQAFRAPATESIEIRNAAGRLVQLLAAGTRGWNGVDAEGHPVAAGVYFLRGTATSRTERVVRLR